MSDRRTKVAKLSARVEELEAENAKLRLELAGHIGANAIRAALNAPSEMSKVVVIDGGLQDGLSGLARRSSQ